MMPETRNRVIYEDASDKEVDALFRAQRLRFLLSVTIAAAFGFGAGAFTTYKIACSLRPRR